MSFETEIKQAIADAVAPVLEQQRVLSAEIKALREALPPALGSKSDAARVMGVSVRTVDRMIVSGELAATHKGRRVLIDLTTLHPFAEEPQRKAG